MLVSFVSWVCMLIVFLTFGFAAKKTVEMIFKYKITKMQNIIMCGIVLVTVYAEVFSCFYKVGFVAVILLAVLSLLVLAVLRREIAEYFKNLFRDMDKTKFGAMLLATVGVTVLGLYLAAREPGGFDTENYHVPSIRWIEEYGVVKGLGNLHTRFAYNSAFLCLQALFSFSWMFDFSVHSVNAFIWVFMVLYCLFGFGCFKKRRFVLSDFLRIVFLLVLFRLEEMKLVTSPNTDFMPLCILAFLFIEWCVLNEEKNDSYVPYGLLSILGLFDASVKLSAAVAFLFAVKPIIGIIKEKKWVDILKFAVMGLIIILPFLVRNVIISGYLIYPFVSLDLFSFDWEIPKSVIISDSAAIKAFARTDTDWKYTDLDRSFTEWFKIWLGDVPQYFDILGVVNLILALAVIVCEIFRAVKRKKGAYDRVVSVVSATGFLYLLFSAPLVRFGRWWFYCLPAVSFYMIFTVFGTQVGNKIYNGEKYKSIYKQDEKFKFGELAVGVCVICLGYLTSLFINDGVNFGTLETAHLIKPCDYSSDGVMSDYVEISGYKFYYYRPDVETHYLNGYYGFPGSECKATLTRIELRGENLSDGFRVNATSENLAYDFQGWLITGDGFYSLGLDKYYEEPVAGEDDYVTPY